MIICTVIYRYMGVTVVKMSGRNGMVDALGRAVTTMIGIRKSFAVALAQKVTNFTGKKTLSLNFATVSKLFEPAVIQFS